MNLYLENLTFPSFLFVYLNKYLKDISQNSKHIIYYIDASRIGKICGQLFVMMFGVEFQQLKFKMMDFKDDNGELVRYRITRKDLFEVQIKIIQSFEYQQLLESRAASYVRPDLCLCGGLSGSKKVLLSLPLQSLQQRFSGDLRVSASASVCRF